MKVSQTSQIKNDCNGGYVICRQEQVVGNSGGEQ